MAEADPGIFERLITAADVAESLHLDERTVLRWAREGKLPGYKVGKFWRFRSSALDAFVVGALSSISSQSARVK
jgi:excisionase family DNA binding protein